MSCETYYSEMRPQYAAHKMKFLTIGLAKAMTVRENCMELLPVCCVYISCMCSAPRLGVSYETERMPETDM